MEIGLWALQGKYRGPRMFVQNCGPLRDGLEIVLGRNPSSLALLLLKWTPKLLLTLSTIQMTNHNCYNAIVIDCIWLLSRIRKSEFSTYSGRGIKPTTPLQIWDVTCHDFCILNTPPVGVCTFVELDRGGVGSIRYCNLNNA
ncbi:hypothetical protein LIER_32961 [Lithospermum erythrorhizon]|uniref:Uncharacterized protein n=1 Tax=Lithospermum erythrorhizon TaxID=34254 RepID=A0AAV3RVE5_LITER